LNESGKRDLKDVVSEVIVINPAQFVVRREASVVLCDTLGFRRVRFSQGTSGLPHQLACTMAHRGAMESVATLPSLILEDDLEIAGQSTTLPALPPDADIVYLSVSQFGCLPWTSENLALARHRALKGLTLTSVYNSDWLKVHSMSGGQAIMYVTTKGLDVWKQATLQAKRFGAPFDVFTAYAMKEVNVYAPHRPLFSESGVLQRDNLRDNDALFNQRLSYTSTPLKPFAAGDQTVVYFKGQKITVEAVGLETDRLQWVVVEAVKRDLADSAEGNFLTRNGAYASTPLSLCAQNVSEAVSLVRTDLQIGLQDAQAGPQPNENTVK
jgi:hypothetical protein